jgi:GTP-binding protein
MRYTTQFLLSAMAAAQFPCAGCAGDCLSGPLECGQIEPAERAGGREGGQSLATPGRTRAINFFALLDQSQRRKLVFADLPGYGYAKISKSISAGWPAFIEPYLAIRSTLKLCVCLVDSNVPRRRATGS